MGIRRTAWIKAARWGYQGREAIFIKSDNAYQKPFYHNLLLIPELCLV